MGRGKQDSSRVTLDGLFEGSRIGDSEAVRRPRRIVVDGYEVVDQLSNVTDLPSSFDGQPARVINHPDIYEETWAENGIIGRAVQIGPAVIRGSRGLNTLRWDWMENGRFSDKLSFNSAQTMEGDTAIYFSKLKGARECLIPGKIAPAEKDVFGGGDNEPNHFALYPDGAVAQIEWLFGERASWAPRRDDEGNPLPSAIEYGLDGKPDSVLYRNFTANYWAMKVPSRINFGPRAHPREGSLHISWLNKNFESIGAVIEKTGNVVILTPQSEPKMTGYLKEASGTKYLVIAGPTGIIYCMKLPESKDFAPDKFLPKEPLQRARDWVNQIIQ